MELQFSAIDNYLSRATGSYAIDTNLNEVARILELIKSGQAKGEILNESHVDGLTRLANLLQFYNMDEALCNIHGVKLLDRCIRPIKRDLFIITHKETTRLSRVDFVVKNVALDHAKDCQYSIPRQLKKLLNLNKIAKSIYDELRFMLEFVINDAIRTTKIPDDDPERLTRKARMIKDLRMPDFARSLFKAIKQIYRNKDPELRQLLIEHDRGTLIDWQTSEGVLKKYIIPKCEFVIDSLDDLMFAANYNQMIRGQENIAYNEIERDYYAWMEYYRLCTRVVGEDAEVLKDNFAQILDTRT